MMNSAHWRQMTCPFTLMCLDACVILPCSQSVFCIDICSSNLNHSGFPDPIYEERRIYICICCCSCRFVRETTEEYMAAGGYVSLQQRAKDRKYRTARRCYAV